eukprot:TRINITY_DN18016_c0_g1_i1.p1 TRINITY_DN18016_c0_g1~~TRINITY_DN18016_c0_g1_i1.p1  ORF type:complete len:717 (+),score=116.87 TRINITY_DN18016_c0_g1_i1:247-2151(+)
MAADACGSGKVEQFGTCGAYTPPEYPGDPFFKDFSQLLQDNPVQLNYGISVTDVDADGKFEAVVAGYRYPNLAWKWDADAGKFSDVARGHPALQDASLKAIGLAACDVDGDGYEELYILNTDQYSGVTRTSDRLIDFEGNAYSDRFSETQNQGSANYVAGRSCACVDRMQTGKYGVMVANYGGPMKLFEVQDDGKIEDVGPSAAVDKTTGGRALIAGPILSNRFDIFANNEGWHGRRLSADIEGGAEEEATAGDWESEERRLTHFGTLRRDNFFFVNGPDGSYLDVASALGLLDPYETGRGTALLDSNGDGLLDIVYGNWNGPHRLYVQEEDANGCVKFVDRAPAAMKVPSRIRTVIVADWDNDGYEEIFWNNIPGDNRLFRKLPTDDGWVQVKVGDALESQGYGTGAAVGDFDEDGLLELFVSHGESAAQAVTYFRPMGGAGNHWIRILPKTAQGAPARGALVSLVAGGRRQVRVIDAGSGYLCQQEPVAHFGLGKLTAVESVTVQWPDGTKLVLDAPAIDQLHTVAKPASGEVEPAYTFTLEGSCLKRSRPAGTGAKTASYPLASASAGKNSSASADAASDSWQQLKQDSSTTESPQAAAPLSSSGSGGSLKSVGVLWPLLLTSAWLFLAAM